MSTTHRKLFLWAGIFCIISLVSAIIFVLLMNFIFQNEYSRFLYFFQNDLGLLTSVSNIKTYINSAIINSILVNFYLSFRYFSYSNKTVKELTQKGNFIFLDLIINAFLGGNFISLILNVVAIAKPLTPSFSDKMIKSIDSNTLDTNTNIIAKIIKIKQDKLNGLISDDEFKMKINKLLEEEARRFL